jgi:multidrug efflux pump
MAESAEGTIMSVLPPAIEEMGTTGFTLRLQDRGNLGMQALNEAQAQLMVLQQPKIAYVYPEGLPPGSNVDLKIDRNKAEALGVNLQMLQTLFHLRWVLCMSMIFLIRDVCSK